MYVKLTYSKVPRSDRKAPAKSLKSLIAKSSQSPISQSPAKLRKAQCFRHCKASQSSVCRVLPYGKGPAFRRLQASAPLPRVFGGASEAELIRVLRLRTRGIPHGRFAGEALG